MKECLTEAEQSLLLYLETCVVDRIGRVHDACLSNVEYDKAQQWAEKGLISFGRIRMADCTATSSHWVQLSDSTWKHVHRLRRERADRQWKKRRYRTTEEKNKNGS